MTRVTTAGLAILAMFALSLVGVSSASAQVCSISTQKLGNFDNRSAQGRCINDLGNLHLGLFILTTPGKGVGGGIECAKAASNEKGEKEGNFSDEKCEKEVSAGSGEFIKVYEKKLTLPDVSIGLGGKLPLHLQFADNGKTPTKLETTGGSTISGAGFKLELTTEALSASGTFEAALLHVKEGTIACNTVGSAKEEVRSKGAYAIVPVSLKPLEAGVLFELEEVSIECGKAKIRVKGSVIATLSAGEGELVEVGGKLEGSKGKNTLTKFINDEEKEESAKLEANFGTGFIQADEVVGEELKLKALESKMFEITGR